MISNGYYVGKIVREWVQDYQIRVVYTMKSG
jgi:hypothetical protein